MTDHIEGFIQAHGQREAQSLAKVMDADNSQVEGFSAKKK